MRLGHFLPVQPLHDRIDGAHGDTKQRGQFSSLQRLRRMKSPDLAHLIHRQLCLWVSFSRSLLRRVTDQLVGLRMGAAWVAIAGQRSPLRAHIGHVLVVCPEPQVIGIAASRGVAAMQYPQSSGDRPVRQHIGQAVGAMALALATAYPEAAIPAPDLGTSPQPAAARVAGPVNLRPKARGVFVGILGLRHLRLHYRLRVSPCRGLLQAVARLSVAPKYTRLGGGI